MKHLNEINDWQDAINNIVNADCLELMKKMPDKCIDLVLTDPPYGIGFDKEFETMSAGIRKDGTKRSIKSWSNPNPKKYKKNDWDNKIPSKEIFDEIFRISKNQIIWGGNYFTDYLKPTGSWIIWDKKLPKGMTLSDGEMAWCSINNSIKIFRYLWAGYKKEEPEDRKHPTQKPLNLARWCIENYTKEEERKNMIIFDPFGGSFTFARACKDFSIDFISCDTDEDYCLIGEERLKQQNLF